MTLQNQFDILRAQGSPQRLLELRPSAYRISRRIGSQSRIITIASLVITPFILLHQLSDNTHILTDEMIISIIVFVSIFSSIVIVANELFLKTFASQITINEASALENLAASGNSEAAFCLAELHANRGAVAHEFMWLERAAAMEHRQAAKILRKRSS